MHAILGRLAQEVEGVGIFRQGLRRLFGLLGLVGLVGLLLLGGGCEGEGGPRIEALIPQKAKGGQEIDVVGQGFGGADRAVSFGGTLAQIRFWENQRVKVQVPQLAPGVVIVVVTIDGRRSLPENFEVLSGSLPAQ